MSQSNTYPAIGTDLKKLQARIARRQTWCNQETKHGDLEAARMYEQDVKDLTDILNTLTAADYQGAWPLIDRLDTAVRDDIPPRLYNFIAKENGYN